MLTNSGLDREYWKYAPYWCSCVEPSVDDADECTKCGKDWSRDIMNHFQLITLARKGLAAQYFVEAWDDAVKCSKPLYQTNDAFRRAYIKFHLDTAPRSGDEERKT